MLRLQRVFVNKTPQSESIFRLQLRIHVSTCRDCEFRTRFEISSHWAARNRIVCFATKKVFYGWAQCPRSFVAFCGLGLAWHRSIDRPQKHEPTSSTCCHCCPTWMAPDVSEAKKKKWKSKKLISKLKKIQRWHKWGAKINSVLALKCAVLVFIGSGERFVWSFDSQIKSNDTEKWRKECASLCRFRSSLINALFCLVFGLLNCDSGRWRARWAARWRGREARAGGHKEDEICYENGGKAKKGKEIFRMNWPSSVMGRPGENYTKKNPACVAVWPAITDRALHQCISAWPLNQS